MDYYEVLGVDRQATQEQIDETYRQLARQWHPDMHGEETKEEAEAKFKEINAAFEVLHNPQKRADYDRRGGGGFGGDDQFGSIYERFFHAQQHRGENGAHIVEKVELTLEEVAAGCRREIKIERNKICDQCDGAGGEVGNCETCQGRGWEQVVGPNIVVRKPCSRCHGKGQNVVKQCSKCSGSGVITGAEETISLDIPAGVEDGVQISYRGAGQPGRLGGYNGDFVLIVMIKSHDFFVREPRSGNIYCNVPLSYWQLVKGCKIEVPTIDKVAVLKIPAGTQPGAKFRLKNKGLPIMGSQLRGDLYMCAEMQVPKQLSSEESKLIKALSEIENETPEQSRFRQFVVSKNV